MTPEDIVRALCPTPFSPVKEISHGQASPNIALIKYWGKRDETLFLPVTSSLSVSLSHWYTKMRLIPADQFSVELNGEAISPEAGLYKRLNAYLLHWPFDINTVRVETEANFPVGAGLASSASAFAALVKALNEYFGLRLPLKQQSILARIGSGSACRSVFEGFVQWHHGQSEDGMDSLAEALPYQIPGLCMAVLMISDQAKPIGSTQGMKHTVETSPQYKTWPEQVAHDLNDMHQALKAQDFSAMGAIAERNAMSMHATMWAAQPAVVYHHPDTLAAMQRIWALRQDGVEVYFTQDAGPNLKLFFTEKSASDVSDALGLDEYHVVSPP